jgi:hypothetical protein
MAVSRASTPRAARACRFTGSARWRKVKAPDISGNWYLEDVHSSKKGQKAWQFFVRQNGADVTAAILRIDGDTGALTGSYKDGKFVLSHFDGAH